VSRTSIVVTMVLGSHNVDKIVESKMDVVRVRAKFTNGSTKKAGMAAFRLLSGSAHDLKRMAHRKT